MAVDNVDIDVLNVPVAGDAISADVEADNSGRDRGGSEASSA